MGLVLAGQPGPVAKNAHKKLMKNPHRAHTAIIRHPSHKVCFVHCKSRYRKRAEKKKALEGTRDLLASLERSVRPWPREAPESGFQFPVVLQNPPPQAFFWERIWDTRGTGISFLIQSLDVSHYSKAETTLIRVNSKERTTRLLYRKWEELSTTPTLLHFLSSPGYVITLLSGSSTGTMCQVEGTKATFSSVLLRSVQWRPWKKSKCLFDCLHEVTQTQGASSTENSQKCPPEMNGEEKVDAVSSGS